MFSSSLRSCIRGMLTWNMASRIPASSRSWRIGAWLSPRSRYSWGLMSARPPSPHESSPNVRAACPLLINPCIAVGYLYLDATFSFETIDHQLIIGRLLETDALLMTLITVRITSASASVPSRRPPSTRSRRTLLALSSLVDTRKCSMHACCTSATCS